MGMPLVLLVLVLVILGVSACYAAARGAGEAPSGPTRGPLRVHPENPRYFAEGSGRVTYLTGSHVWFNLKDLGPNDPPPAFDYAAYLKRMKAHNQNFMRMWTWDLVRFNSERAEGMLHSAQPFPWQRTGPGPATDGKPRFDLSRLEEDYFDRLRTRVSAARDQGIYVSVMLFEGWGAQMSAPPWCWQGHPFHVGNNINGIDGNPTGSERGLDAYTLRIPAVTRVQEAYVRKVVDTVNDLDNVLYEISNEAGPYSTDWQYHMIRFVKGYEGGKPQQHPVGMTFQFKGGTNEALFESPADWISPGPEGGYREDPPPADGNKVILSDTDHLWGLGGNRTWVWKTFLRGMNPLYMDDLDDPLSPFGAEADDKEEIRAAMGHTLLYANVTNLAKMLPRGDLASTGYCLAQTGVEYLVLQPHEGAFTLGLPDEEQPYAAEWFDTRKGSVVASQAVTAGGLTEFKPPLEGEAVLHLKTVL
jgi:hypothetical protein